ncbi:MAG: YigZ family protein, partial [Aminobacterium colombiense]|nr:YigZ family protein [Aminobacterium colombiense]
MIVDEFWEPAENISTEIKIKRSIFIAHISVARTEEDARQFVTHISQKHKQATHNCWAYRIGVDPPREYSSDDG